MCVRVYACGPSVLTRLLESDKKSDWTRLENEYRAGEGEKGRETERDEEDDWMMRMKSRGTKKRNERGSKERLQAPAEMTALWLKYGISM